MTTSKQPIPKLRRKGRIGPWILIIFGVFALIGGLLPDKKTPENGKQSDPMAAVAIGALMIAGGAYWRFSAGKVNKGAVIRDQDKQILSVAARHSGRTTIAQILIETDLSAEEAEESLNRLCRQNIAQPDLLDEGSVVYLFGLLQE